MKTVRQTTIKLFTDERIAKGTVLEVRKVIEVSDSGILCIQLLRTNSLCICANQNDLEKSCNSDERLDTNLLRVGKWRSVHMLESTIGYQEK